MKKSELFRIMSLTDSREILEISNRITGIHKAEILKNPEKQLVMLKVRESARNTLFYAGEALACECMVKIGDTKGFAVCLGDDLEKVHAMAVIDATLNAELPESAYILDALTAWKKRIGEAQMREAKLTTSTKVDFHVMEE